jgi:1-(5-phosphoribosyl)-5-[(5-phosphoribosylamino)methylideneamino] imidazole-4-carboxamide isomerase/N-(5'phosphoribosyl)anthranilate isomerase
MTKQLELLPAVDVQNGKAVRLVQGERGTEQDFGDPLEVALNWQKLGAQWIHLVDLDRAFGTGSNFDELAKIVGHLDIKVEISGGIRDDESLKAALSTGATRVNLGTAALESPQWTQKVIGEYQEKIAIGLDVRGNKLSARGWTKEGGDLFETLERLEKDGAARYVVTDVNKDGTLQGVNTDLLIKISQVTNKPLIASGGIGSLDDIQKLVGLTPLGVEGAILGKALYANRFTLPQALEIANRKSNDPS